jgi:predicted amidohydrolase
MIMHKPFKIVCAQPVIDADINHNCGQIKNMMRRAAHKEARLIHFPEGALSGYIKTQIKDWEDVNWSLLKKELEAIAELAGQLKIWVVIGSNHRLTYPNRPHNSLYVISDQGKIEHRYDKRLISHVELKHWYTPGKRPVVFEVDGVRFGLATCIEINFAEIFLEYESFGVDCLLCSSYSDNPDFKQLAIAHSMLNCFWFSLALPANVSKIQPSVFVGPDGKVLKSARRGRPSIIFHSIDPDDPAFKKALKRSRPWRRKARSKNFFEDFQVDDPRSRNQNVL